MENRKRKGLFKITRKTNNLIQQCWGSGNEREEERKEENEEEKETKTLTT